jgi:hypothetical protein
MKYPQMEPIKDTLKKDYNIIVSKNKVTVSSVTSAYFWRHMYQFTPSTLFFDVISDQDIWNNYYFFKHCDLKKTFLKVREK